MDISGLNRTAFDLAVYASQGRLPTRHARLASGCWSSSTGRDWLPAGFPTKGFKFVSYPPFLELTCARSGPVNGFRTLQSQCLCGGRGRPDGTEAEPPVKTDDSLRSDP